MKEHAKSIIAGLFCFPLAVIFYFIYAHVVSFLDPILTIVLGGGFILAIIALLFNFFVGIKDIIVSLFKEDDEVDEKGFKKNF